MSKLKNGTGVIFTIESYNYTDNNGNITYTIYFDLLSDLTFAIFRSEVFIMSSKNPNECIKELKKRNCLCSENFDYKYLIK